MVAIVLAFSTFGVVVSSLLLMYFVKFKYCYQIGVVTNAITERYLFGWRISLSIQILVSGILVVGAIFIPETPRQVAHV